MQTHPSHLLLALLPVLIGWAALASGAFTVAWILFGLAAVLALLVCVIAPIDSAAHLIYERREFLKAYTAADPQSRDALGLKYPNLRLSMNGAPVVTVEDSQVPLSYFRMFLDASNREYIAKEGNYGDKSPERKQWFVWKAWLVDKGYIYEDRYQVNRPWAWRKPEYYWSLYNKYVRLHIPEDLLPDQPEAPAGTKPMPANPAEAELIGQFQ